tara:strand:- start:6618 stop:6911 length:294 start_codon:yes stop_codon:yes gene_type:complete
MEADLNLISLLTGPASSVVLLGGMALGAARFTTGTLVPAVSRWVDAHLKSVDALIVEHRADREAWLQQISECRAQHKRMEDTLSGIHKILIDKPTVH